MRTHLTDTVSEITRIQRQPPPLLALPLLNDTMVTRAWVNDPIHDDVSPMRHHVIAPTLRGDGSSTVRFGNKSISAPSITGGITVAPRGFWGRFDCDGRPTASNVFLSKGRLQRCSDELDGGRVPELIPRLNCDDQKLFSILSLISAEAEASGPHARLYLEQLIDLLSLQLLRTHAAFPLRNSQSTRGLRTWQVSRLTKYMQDRLDEPIALQDLADLLGMSRFHLCAAFRQATGHTPHEWLVGLRMRRARQLLVNTRMTITDIAMAVGYQTSSSFALAFRRSEGSTPTEYRARNERYTLGDWDPTI